MEAGATTTMTAKLPILNLGEYDLWLMRIEQYFLMTDYSLWEVIKNGNKVLKNTVGTNGIRGYDWSYQAEEEIPTNYAFMALTSSGSSSSSKSEVDSCSKSCMKAYANLKEQYDSLTLDFKKSQYNLLSYKAGNCMPPKHDLRLIDEHFESVYVDVISNIAPSDVKTVKTIDVNHKGVFSTKGPKPVMTNTFSPPIIEDWHSDDESEEEISPTIQVYYGLDPQKSLTLLFYVHGNPQHKEYKEKGVIDSGCSRHMTRNKCYLTNFEAYDGGFVSFGNGKGRISGKGIKREFSIARTPQENRVAERRNRTLIEAARTMLVDSKLPTTFWAEAVNTACYVQNKALVTKPHNKTPYELIRGRPPLIDFMKPFGCPVTILNTRYNLGKFEGKANEGYFVGYSVVIVVGNQTNGIVGSKENLVAGSKDSVVDAGKKAPKVYKSEASDNGGKNDQVSRSEVEGLPQQVRQTENINSTKSFNTVGSPVNTIGSSFVNAASQTPINVAGPSTSTNAFEEHSFERFSPFKNAFSLLHVPIVTIIDDTGIFGNAYDDEVLKEGVDMNNNKKDERGILIKNKARLVAHGHTQEEGIDYDEVFASVARIEAIRLFLAYASFKDFVVYQMDVKSAFLYGRIEEEATAKMKRVNKKEQIQALVDKTKVIITRDSIKSDLRFDDAEGTACLLNEAIFKGLARMGTMASVIICLADNQKFNFSKCIFDNMVKSLEGGVKFYLFLRFLQVFQDNQVEGVPRNNEMYIISSYTKKIFANMRRIGA
nr:retrovirus-related Pol polyprotein from transposon TNT 1-94 [Tanacetum cinerariifolium]